MLVVRATTLESFWQCPKKFMETKRVDDDDTTIRMYIGDIGHMAHQNPYVAEVVLDHYFDKIVPQIKGEKDNLTKDKIKDVLKVIEEWLERFTADVRVYEMRLATVLNKVIVTGTLDLFAIEDGEINIYDFKIVTNSDYYQDKENRLQPYIYGLLVCENFGLDEVDFTYLAYEKKNKPVLKKIKYHINYKEAKEKLYPIVEEYRVAMEYGIYRPKKNTFCRGCPLYKEGKCPLREKKDEIEIIEDVDIFSS